MNQLELPPLFYVFLGMGILLMIANLAMFIAFAVAAFKLIGTLKALEPKVTRLADQVSEEIVPKVNSLIGRMDSISANVQGMTSSASSAVNTLSSGVGSASNAIGNLAETGFKSVERFAPLVGYLMLAVKLFQTVAALRTAVAKPDGPAKRSKGSKAA